MNDPVTHGEGRTRFTDFRMEMKTNMPVFKVKDDKSQISFNTLCSNIEFLLPIAERSVCSETLFRVQMVEG